jgi:hypothetical protein
MDPDVVMSFGIALGLVSFPPLIGTILSDTPISKVAGFMAIVALTIMVIAALQKPGGYNIVELPGIFIDVIGRFF